MKPHKARWLRRQVYETPGDSSLLPAFSRKYSRLLPPEEAEGGKLRHPLIFTPHLREAGLFAAKAG
ncbi:MAG: hypothetical protein N3E46_03275 [Gemmataceae bacterium]|nr:hypothetical protein [Gemmataceae bacterium]